MTDVQYAVLARYGLDKLAADPSLLSRAGGAAKWLFSRHPNAHTYEGLASAGSEITRGKNWLGREVWKHKPMVEQAMQTLPGRGPGLLNALKDQGHAWGDVARDIYFGSPVDAWKDFQNKRWHAGSTLGGLGRFAKDYYWHPQAGGVMNSLGVAATGYDLYHALTGDESQRKGDMAAALTGAAIAPVTGHLGTLIGAPVHLALTGAARRLGHKFDAPAPGAEAPSFSPRVDPRGHTRRWLRTSPNIPYLGEGFPDLPDVPLSP